MFEIKKVKARWILDSRGNPTVQCDITLNGGGFGRASVPSGASTGIHEALELRDGGKAFNGKGVEKAVKNVNTLIAKQVIGLDARDLETLDSSMKLLDGTENKSRLGANAILSVSLAATKAVANQEQKELYKVLGKGNILPVPMMNILNGGSHADNALDFQEFMIVPKGAKTIQQAVQMGSEVFHSLKKKLKEKGFNTNVGDEGGFAPNLGSADEALSLIVEAINDAGYKAGKDIFIALDTAASEFYKDGKYILKGMGKTFNTDELLDYYETLIKKYPIISIEDGLDQDDWYGWQEMTKRFGKKIQIVGDDLFVTNPERLAKGINEKAANAILIKLNQIGTLTETLETIKMAQKAGYGVVISHRSGETEDTTIADLAVATNAGQIKTGSVSRTDRVAKYNRLMQIAETLGSSAKYGKK